jgi:hypothetical protein
MQHVWWRSAHTVLMGKPEVKRPHGRPKQRWEDNIKKDLHKVIWWVGGSWAGLIWLRIGTRWWALVNMAMNFQVP